MSRLYMKTLHRSRFLLDAIRNNNAKLVRFLLQQGVNANVKDSEDGESALHAAVMSDNTEIIRLLLNHGADVDEVNGIGLQALEIAFQFGRPSAHLELLLNRGARISMDDFGGYSCRADRELVEPLYEYVDLNARDVSGKSALHLAAKCDHPGGVRTLLRRGAYVNVRTTDDAGLTPLHLAAEHASIQCMEVLLQHGADPNMPDELNNSPLVRVLMYHQYCRIDDCAQSAKLEMLLDHGADIKDSLLKAWVYEASKDSFRVLIKYMSVQEKDRMRMRKKNKLPFADVDLFAYYMECQKEIERMQTHKIFKSVTIYDYLVKNTSTLARYTGNEEVTKLFKSEIVYENFPIYSHILHKHFEAAAERKKLVKFAALGLSAVIDCIDENHIVTQTILDFLTTKDMRNLIYIAKQARYTK